MLDGSVNMPNGTVTAPTRIRACSWSSNAFASFQIRAPNPSNRNRTTKGLEDSGPV